MKTDGHREFHYTAISALLLLTSLISSVFSYFTFGPQTLSFQLFGLVATGVVCFYLINGKKWAQRIIKIAMIVGILGSGTTAMAMAASRSAFIYLMVQGMVYAGTLVTLLIFTPEKTPVPNELDSNKF